MAKVILGDFERYEVTTLIGRARQVWMIKKSHQIYHNLVKEFYTNFNHQINNQEAKHEHCTWVRDKWIMFITEVIDEYHGQTHDNIVPMPMEQDMVLMVQMLYGGQDEVHEEFKYNKLTHYLQVLMKFICHNIEPTLHMSTFNFAKARL